MVNKQVLRKKGWRSKWLEQTAQSGSLTGNVAQVNMFLGRTHKGGYSVFQGFFRIRGKLTFRAFVEERSDLAKVKQRVRSRQLWILG